MVSTSVGYSHDFKLEYVQAGEHPHSAVQTQAQAPIHMPHPHSPHPVRDRDHEHDVKGLRLALGSILSPVCPPTIPLPLPLFAQINLYISCMTFELTCVCCVCAT